MTSGESEKMYAHHVPHTFLHPIPEYKKSPEPRKIPGIFLCTPDWIRTSDLQSRSCFREHMYAFSEGGIQTNGQPRC